MKNSQDQSNEPEHERERKLLKISFVQYVTSGKHTFWRLEEDDCIGVITQSLHTHETLKEAIEDFLPSWKEPDYDDDIIDL